jgi:SAM-dependent methyltransferase/uncharacterized protein YbaR (Trm112 family)
MKPPLLRLLQCPFCGGSLSVRLSESNTPDSEYGVLSCLCSRYPIVAGIPVIKKGVVGNNGQDANQVIDMIEAGRHRDAFLAMVLPPPPLSVMRAPASVDALRAWRDHAEALFSIPHDQITVCDLVDFFYSHIALSDAYTRQRDQPDIRNYFLYRFSQPRYAIALSLCSVISHPARPVLDLGCGVGHITAKLFERAAGQPVVGLDRDFFALYLAKNWLVPGGTYIYADADRVLPFVDGALSAILCSDAFQVFENRVNCVREMARVTRPDGVMIFSSLPATPERHRGSLGVKGFEALLGDMPHRLIAGIDVLSRYLQKRGPSLTDQTAHDRLAADPWLSIIVSHDQSAFTDGTEFDDWPHAGGTLQLDPLYREERRDEFGNVQLRRVFPSRWFEYENTERRLKNYLPETICVSTKTLDDLSRGNRTQEVENLIGQCVVMGFPDRYLPSDYRATKEPLRPLEATVFGSFYIEQAKVSDLIMAVVPTGNTYIMVDENEWDVGHVGGDRKVIKFFERDGQYWGPPSTSEEAIHELDRLRAAGATFLVFGWPAIWWIEHYLEFGRHLYGRYRCVLQNDRLMIFDLQSTLVM